MKITTKNLIYACICLVVATIGVGPEIHRDRMHKQKEPQVVIATTNNSTPKNNVNSQSNTHCSHMRTPIDWHKSSETVPYPDLSKVNDFWIKVSFKKEPYILI